MSLSVPATLSVLTPQAEIIAVKNMSFQLETNVCPVELGGLNVPKMSLQPQAGWTLVPALDGGAFSPWNSGDVFDGGAFSPWNSGDSFFGGYIDFVPPNISIQMVLLH